MNNPARIGVVCFLVAQASFAGEVRMPSLDTFYDQWTWLATHNSYSNPDEGFNGPSSNQPDSITAQLDYGVRVINPDVWLVRQKMVGTPKLGTCKWEFEEYPEDSTEVRNNLFKNISLEVVTAHGDDDSLFGGFRQACTPWKSFRLVLAEIRQWVQAHPNEVITLALENKVAWANQRYVNDAFKDSGLEDCVFYLDRANLDVPAPEGRAGGWDIRQYGFPTLRHLVNHGKSVVRMAELDQWRYAVSTVYGAESLTQSKWTNPRTESWPLTNFTRRSFDLIHIPNLPTGQDFGEVNSILTLRDKWEDIRKRWNRLPNSTWFDFYNRGFSLPLSAPPGPALFVNELNAIWKSLPEITPVAQLSPTASAYGWHNTNVQVNLSGAGDNIQAIISRTFGAQSLHDNGHPTNRNSYLLSANGVTTVSFAAVGDLGKRSTNRLVHVRIDKTPPTITGQLSRPPDRNGWYASNVTARFTCADALSGIAFCPPEIIVATEGANQSVTGMAIDRADNWSTATITNINIDRTAPVIRATANPSFLWPPNGKLVPMVISGAITDAASGVDPASLSFSVEDEYRRNQPGGRITLGRSGAFSVTIRLEAKRNGNDRDGRHYLVQLNARDGVGHSSQSTLVIAVPHDNRSR